MKRIAAFLALVLTSLTVLASCEGGGTTFPETQSHYTTAYFDTRSIFSSYLGDSKAAFRENCDELEAILEKYHKLFNIYYEYSGLNNLRTINILAGKEPVKVERELIDFLIYAKEMYNVTDGEVNIMMGSVLRLWHDCREAALDDPALARIPTEAELAEAEKHISIDALVIDEEASTVYITDSEASIDVGALGKGYAAQRAAEHLREKGVTSYVLNIGGNICAIGEKAKDTPWVTGITNPDTTSDEPFVLRISLFDTALVTSGDYHRFFIVDGKAYHHIIDKDTMMPSEYFSSVSILTSDSALADALSTALFSMSYEDGLKLVETLGGVEVLWVDKEGGVRMTDGFEALVIKE